MADGARREIAVIGGGIAGLSAAWELSGDPQVSVTLIEADDHVGGKLRAAQVAGVTVDVGAESMLALRPEALTLASEVGLKPSIVHPSARVASVLSRGHLRQLPPGLVTGVPTDLRALAASRIMSLPGLLRIPMDQLMRATEIGSDVSVGDFLGERLGREVVERLAEPLLAGVYAGDPYNLSLRMANPSLFRQLTREKSLLNAANSVRSGSAVSAGARRGPVFAGLRGGVSRLAEKTTASLRSRGAVVLTGTPVDRLRRVRHRWQVHTPEGTREYDGVVLAVPAPVAARLLRYSAPFAAMQLLSVEYASVAVVTLAYPASQAERLHGSGFLSPPVEGHHVKGVTYSTNKWEWLAREAKSKTTRGTVIVRASFGRHGDAAVLDNSDAQLAALAREELREIAGLTPVTVDEVVTRWDDALPQYRVGHVDLVTRARDSLVDAPGVALAGAAYDGVGIASCIVSGRQAARKTMRDIQENVVEQDA